MFGEPTPDPARFTRIDSRSILNFDVAYHSPNREWSLALYGRNVTDEEYENARLNTGDYILAISEQRYSGVWSALQPRVLVRWP